MTTPTTSDSPTDTTSAAGPPATGTWTIDPAHSTVEAVARHLRITKVRSRFNAFEGTVQVAEPATDSSVAITIEATSFDSNNADRDAHIRSQDFLDTEQFPQLRFTSTDIAEQGPGEYAITGDLTVRDVTRPVVLDTEYGGLTQDPWGNTRALFAATTRIDREDWGLTWNQALETGGVLVSKEIDIEIEVQLVQA